MEGDFIGACKNSLDGCKNWGCNWSPNPDNQKVDKLNLGSDSQSWTVECNTPQLNQACTKIKNIMVSSD